MAYHWLAPQGHQRLLLQSKMLRKYIRPGPLPSENNARPLHLQLASPKYEKSGSYVSSSGGTLKWGLAGKNEYCNI
jgi:hypothetical protein